MAGNRSYVFTSSSPDFPSASELLNGNCKAKAAALRPCGHVNPDPPHVAATLTSPSVLWRSGTANPKLPVAVAVAGPDLVDAAILEPEQSEPAKKRRKPRAPRQPKTTDKGKEKAKARPQDGALEAGTTSPSGQQGSKKFNPDVVDDAKPPEPQGAKSAARAKAPRRKAETKSSYFPNSAKTQPPKVIEVVEMEDSFELEPADVLGKRKLIELVTTDNSKGPKKAETSAVKTKAPKKKPRTITELATAAYRIANPADETTESSDAPAGSLLAYFPVREGADAQDNAAKDGDESGPQKTTKKKKSTFKVTKKKAEANKKKQLLLSPESALRQVARQDFVFGTASQLAVEDDPALLRALHEAMLLSNQEDHDPFASSSPVPPAAAVRSTTRRLWGAGARDGDGYLHEVIDLVHSPAVPSDLQGHGTKTVVTSAGQSDMAFVPSSDFDPEFPPIEQPRSDFFSTQTGKATIPTSVLLGPSKPATLTGTPSHLGPEREFEPPASNQEHNEMLAHSQAVASPSRDAPLAAPAIARPNHDLLSDAELAKRIAKYGFKPVKKRAVMIALLDQCWVSKKAEAAPTAPVAPAVSPKRPAASPKRPRGRPRKDAATAAKTITTTTTTTTTTMTEVTTSPKRPRGRPNKVVAADDAMALPAKQAKSPAKRKAAAKPATMRSPSPAPVASISAAVAVVASTPKRRKIAAAAAASPTREVADSDADPFASSSSSALSTPDKWAAAGAIFSSPSGPIELSITDATETSVLPVSPAAPTSTAATDEERLAGFITAAITSAPPGPDTARPSWHEKMLMYDPVVLEDLAAWLNTGPLDQVGYDGEVSPLEVKKWCEARSVCCLWRVNVHGKERKRM
ncbi:hypothetical protein P8C59_008373 [Phyllachora maydis]|uniref:Structure-specific endonuclease subunit SLX4 n=1 Tax=Phyllachora maydis TaxID=1825666 RepID=A0AAD9MEI4_9PEZI|nr:hypothetical protein P8C59_008373 [Phyllachora maydis]